MTPDDSTANKLAFALSVHIIVSIVRLHAHVLCLSAVYYSSTLLTVAHGHDSLRPRVW